MSPISCLAAVEDSLSEAIARAVLGHCGFEPSQVIGLTGVGYIRKNASRLNTTASHYPVFVLADLDSLANCPRDLMNTWIKGPVSANLIFRFAVVEVESWVMADRERFGEFLGVRVDQVPRATDELSDPKLQLINLVRKCKRANLRRGLVPAQGSTALIGPEYNPLLGQFVATRWRAEAAAKVSPSLGRTLRALQAFRRKKRG